jgi:hypothetical protein
LRTAYAKGFGPEIPDLIEMDIDRRDIPKQPPDDVLIPGGVAIAATLFIARRRSDALGDFSRPCHAHAFVFGISLITSTNYLWQATDCPCCTETTATTYKDA